MKKQKIFLQGTTIALTFLACILLSAGCSSPDAKQRSEDNGSAGRKQLPPPIDIHSAILSADLAAVQQHIAAHSNLEEKDPLGGSSPLITACLFGKTAIAKALIDANAAINVQNNDGSTPLHTASFFCRPEIVKMLLDKKADRTIRNKYGQTALDIVSGPFDSVKNVYDDLGKALAPMGLQLDHSYLKITRPQIAAMLKDR